MDILSVLENKKRGKALSAEEIGLFVRGAADHSLPDYQLAALLMAIRLNGMDARETADLTMAMANSGDMLKPDVGGVPVDKHSTGGVGDTTTLVLAPLVAACGGKVLKMSGRGLGHTGGTLDKLESIPGMRIALSEKEFQDIVRTVGCAVVSQSAQLAPADKTLYSLRDVTATVDSIPLIVSSILSKKFAAGAKAIVLDVKTGSGALMPTLEASVELAKAMVAIGDHAGRRIVAVVSGMEEPLGSHVGNALEVKEAIDILAGRAQGPLKRVSLFLGAQMLLASGVADTEEEALEKLNRALDSGAGLQKLKEMIAAQAGLPGVRRREPAAQGPGALSRPGPGGRFPGPRGRHGLGPGRPAHGRGPGAQGGRNRPRRGLRHGKAHRGRSEARRRAVHPARGQRGERQRNGRTGAQRPCVYQRARPQGEAALCPHYAPRRKEPS